MTDEADFEADFDERRRELALERPADLRKVSEPELYFASRKHELVCLDEIQRTPELFPALRSILDETGRPGQLLLLGSASRDLLRQSSESLAGRIGYLELTPFLLGEVAAAATGDVTERLWLRGGFPPSYLAATDEASFEWREQFIRSFLERDLPQLGVGTPAPTLRRFWQMCAHLHGQLLNASKLGEALGVSHTSVRTYLDLLVQTLVMRSLPPFFANGRKRLVKSPKIYVRDSGLLHALLGVESHDDLFGHPVFGASWEGFVIDSVLSHVGERWRASFYRTAAGVEVDLVLEKGRERLAVECKAAAAPSQGRGFWSALDELGIKRAFIVAPGAEEYPLAAGVSVIGLAGLLRRLGEQSPPIPPSE